MSENTIYIIEYVFQREDYDGRSHEETVMETDEWFATPEEAAKYMAENSLRSEEQEIARLKERAQARYEEAMSSYRADNKAYVRARSAGVPDRLLTRTVEPSPPITPVPDRWHQITPLTKHVDKQENPS